MFFDLSGIAVNGGKHMIRQLIEGYVGKIPDDLFKEAALEATKDVRYSLLYLALILIYLCNNKSN